MNASRRIAAGIALAIGVLALAAPAPAAEYASSHDVNLVFWPGSTMTAVGDGGYPATNLLNKYEHSFWNFNGNVTPPPPGWVQLDLGEGNAQTVDLVRFRMWPGQAAAEYWIWVGDDPSGFNTSNALVHKTGNTDVVIEEALTATTGRYVRIQQQHAAPNWYNVSQLAVYSTEAKEIIHDYPISEILSGAAIVTDPDGRWNNWPGDNANGEQDLFSEHKGTDVDSNAWGPRAAARCTQADATLLVELDRLYDVDKFIMGVWNGGFNLSGRALKIELSETGADGSWTTVVDEVFASYMQTREFDFDATTAQFARITVPQQGNDAIFYRMDFYGEPTATEVIPEPASAVLVGLGLVGLLRRRRARR